MQPDIHSDSNKIASNTITQIVARFVILIFSLISIKIITNYLGTSGTGYYNTVITYFSFIIVIADFGLFSVAVREISKNPNSIKKILFNIFTIRLISSIIITLIAILVSLLTSYPPQIKTGLLVASLFPIFNLLSSVYDMLLQYRLEMQKVALSELLAKALTIIVLYLITVFNLGFYAVVFTVSLSSLFIFAFKALLTRKQLPLRFSYDRGLIRDTMKMALPLGAVFIVNNIYFKVDTLILFFFKGAAAVGIYSVAYRVLEVTLFAGSYLSSSLKPLFAKNIDTDQEKVAKTLSQGINFLLFMALAITILCLTFSKELILLLSNNDFISGSQAILILGFVPIFLFVNGILGELMIAKDLRKILIRNSAFILTFNVLINLIIIPRYSFTGAAATTLISEIVLFFVTFYTVKKFLPFRPDYIRIFKLIFVATMSILLGYLLKSVLPFILNLIFILALYSLLAYYIHAFQKELIDKYLSFLRAKFSK